MIQALMLCCCAALGQDGALTLDPQGATTAKLGYYPIPVPLAPAKPKGIVKEPAYASPPLYGVLRMGNGPQRETVLAVDMPASGDWKIYIDRNRNGDLTDDGNGVWNKKMPSTGRRQGYGPMDVTLRASYGTEAAEVSSCNYTVGVYQFTDNRAMFLYRQSIRTGTILLAGKSYRAMLIENDADGLFDKGVLSMEGLTNRKPLWLQIDTAGDGTYAVALDPRAPFEFQGKVYEARINTDGSRVELLPTSREAVDLDTSFRAAAEQKEKSGDLDGAIAEYTRILSKSPRNMSAVNLRGKARQRKGDLDGAVADFNRYLELCPGDASSVNTRAYLHYDRQDWTSALKDFRKSCELNASNPDYDRLRIWLIRARQGERDAANREMAEYLSARKSGKPEDWACKVARFLIGTLPESELLTAARSADAQTTREQECEAYFYIGSARLIAGDKAGAATVLQKCLDTGVTEFLEHSSAAIELKLLK